MIWKHSLIYKWVPMLLVLVFGWLLTWPAQSAAQWSVQRYFQDLQSLRADFVQRVFDEHARIVRTSSGQMLMQKPSKFRWDYQTPAEQIIVADGERLWAYDVDLAQVTVRKLDTALGSTPLALLSGVTPIEDTFIISPGWTELVRIDSAKVTVRIPVAAGGFQG